MAGASSYGTIKLPSSDAEDDECNHGPTSVAEDNQMQLSCVKPELWNLFKLVLIATAWLGVWKATLHGTNTGDMQATIAHNAPLQDHQPEFSKKLQDAVETIYETLEMVTYYDDRCDQQYENISLQLNELMQYARETGNLGQLCSNGHACSNGLQCNAGGRCCIPVGSNSPDDNNDGNGICSNDDDCCGYGTICRGGRCMCEFYYVSSKGHWEYKRDHPPNVPGMVCQLASILNEQEQDEAYHIATSNGFGTGHHLWLGGESIADTNNNMPIRGFRWIDNEPFDMEFAAKHWNSTNGNKGSKPHALSWLDDGTWHDIAGGGGFWKNRFPAIYKCCPEEVTTTM